MADNAEFDNNADIMGSKYGPESRCMQSTLANKRLGASAPGAIRPGCYKFMCRSSDELQVYVDGSWYSCNNNTLSVTGFEGVLYCPPASEMCGSISTSTIFGGADMSANGYSTTVTVPTVTSIEPARGTLLGGFNVTITGV